jgi:hypothetical protein
LQSLDTPDRWLIDVLKRAFVLRSRYGAKVFYEWHPFVTRLLWQASYLQWCTENRIQRPETEYRISQRLIEVFGRQAQKRGKHLTGEVERVVGGANAANNDAPIYDDDRPRGWFVGTIEQARASFAEARKITIETEDDDDIDDLDEVEQT